MKDGAVLEVRHHIFISGHPTLHHQSLHGMVALAVLLGSSGKFAFVDEEQGQLPHFLIIFWESESSLLFRRCEVDVFEGVLEVLGGSLESALWNEVGLGGVCNEDLDEEFGSDLSVEESVDAASEMGLNGILSQLCCLAWRVCDGHIFIPAAVRHRVRSAVHMARYLGHMPFDVRWKVKQLRNGNCALFATGDRQERAEKAHGRRITCQQIERKDPIRKTENQCNVERDTKRDVMQIVAHSVVYSW